ncbi:MAG: protein translocase subunit SecF [Peptostreptococcaceae bacterium]|nr:protein translocase subunit SecF [Peptostreptococcaceae bacterium]
MNLGAKRFAVIIIAVIILLGWYMTVIGIGSMPPVKDKIKLGLDIKGGVYVVMEAQTNETGDNLKKLMEQTQAVIEQRVNQMGLSEPVVTIEGNKRIRVELPGAENAEEAIKSIGKTAQLQFIMADGTVALDGSMIKNAGITQDKEKGGYAVSLEFDKAGSTAFAEATRKALSGQIISTTEGVPGSAILIVLDGKVISSPVVQSVIANGQAIITAGNTGGFPQDEAVNLAALIRGGALPVALSEVDTSIQTASIGLNALDSAVLAGIIGFILILVIMLVMYGIMGLAANIALLLYLLIVLWTLVSLGSVLTLPGIAGIILSIGMAVDANVIIFSRIKEEICNGKSIRVSAQSGFKHAMSTILDSQITTIIAAAVLYQFGSGPVKGFAMTLMIGIVASVFTAMIITQLLLEVIINSKKLSTKKLFRVSEDNRPIPGVARNFNIIKHRKIYYIVSIAILLIGLTVGGFRGFNYGIDFTGGTMMQLDLKTHVETSQVKAVLEKNNIDSEIVYAGKNSEQVIIRTIQSLDNETRGVVIDDMQTAFNITDKDVLTVEQFGPSVGKELRNNAILAVLIATLGMLIYIVIRFEWKFGLAAIAGVAHDVLMVIAFYGLFSFTINSPFIAGILTVVGYSINDTIVVFDRIRENLGIMKKNNTSDLIDTSINQTLGRSIMTSFTTLVVMIPMYVLTSSTIREFILPLMIGVLVGCASSIFVASPIYYDLCKLTGGPKYSGRKSKKKSKE